MGPPAVFSFGSWETRISGNGINHSVALDPSVEDWALLPNLAWSGGSSGNLIKAHQLCLYATALI